MYSQILKIFGIVLFFSLLWVPAEAQTKRKKTVAKKTAPVAAAPVKSETNTQVPPIEVSVKKNERPTSNAATQAVAAPEQKTEPPYRYEFTQPDFSTNKIVIEHDEKGIGKISFARRGGDEMFTDPLTVSANVLKRLNDSFMALNFLDTAESFQFEKDFSHLGNIRISLNRGGSSRTTAFNYTTNKHAKVLADLYRAIANQALWVFDISIARENQRLETPSQMKDLEALIKRNEIADPEQMLPFLRELSDDERLPLIARNHATRIVRSIEKAKK